MKKILLQKERDEVSAASNGNRSTDFHSKVPFSHLSKSCVEDRQNIKMLSDDGNKIEMSKTERSKTLMPPLIGLPSGEKGRSETLSRSEILKVSSLISGASVPLPTVPVLMMAPSAGDRDLGRKYFLGNAGSTVFGLPHYSFPGSYQIGGSQFQSVGPTRVLQHGRMKGEDHIEYEVMQSESLSRASSSLSIPARSHHEESNLPLHGKAELQRYAEEFGFDQKSFATAGLRRSRVEDKRTDTDVESVSSSDIVEKGRSNSMEILAVDSDGEGTSIRKYRTIALDDNRNDDLPRMIDKERQRMQASPLNASVADGYNYTRTESVRSDSVDTFKSPAVDNQKTMCRPKGRPAKMAGSGDIGPGGRSIIRCPVCGKLFNNSSALAKHKLTHSDERKYACSLCSKAFKRQDHLNGHMMTHSSTKPFGCKFIGCNKSYCDARSLRRHMENHHQECATGATANGSSSGYFSFDSSLPQSFGTDDSAGAEKSVSYLQQVSPISPDPRDGPQLSRPFASISSSHPHSTMWVTGYNPLNEPKPIKCGVCGRGFKNIPALNGHMRLHGGYVRKDQDLDELQDVSHGSEPHSESRFSLHSESSQSSTSTGDRQHDSMKSSVFNSSINLSARPNLSGSEPGRRHFIVKPFQAEEEYSRERPQSISNKEPTSRHLYQEEEDFKYFARGNCSNASESRNRTEPEVDNGFQINRGLHYSVFEGYKDEARSLCPSPRNVNRHDEDIQRILALRARHAEEEMNFVKVMNNTTANDVRKIPGDCGTSTTTDCHNRLNCEVQKGRSFNTSCVDLHQQLKSLKKQRKLTDANNVSGSMIDQMVPSESNTVNDRYAAESTGTGCQDGTRQSNQMRSDAGYGRKLDSSPPSQQKAVKTVEEKIQMSKAAYLPDSTSGKEIDQEKNDLKEKIACYIDGRPKLGITAYESVLPQVEIVLNVETDSGLEASDDTKIYHLSPSHDFAHVTPSSQNEQGGCLYRKRWMSLQLKQAGLGYTELPRTLLTSPAKNQYTQANDGANTDSGDPFSPKGISKFGESIHTQSGTCKSYADGNMEASDNVSSSCLPGNHETSIVGARPATPVLHSGQSSSLMTKRGSSGLFNHQNIVLQREVTAAVLHGCHNSGVVGREGLHHVHLNSCIPQTDGIQPNIPCSPYDMHPHTPCAAHTPYTPCQPYTPHTPYTPVNHPGTPKHASHFEFPPRDCLQESSMCDSPFPLLGGHIQRSNQPLEVRLVVEPEGSHYMSQQRQKMVDTETELKSLRHLCQDEPLCRNVTDAADADNERLLRHIMMDGGNHSHLLTQRNLELHRRYSGNPVQTGHPRRHSIQSEAGNPDEGMSASLPTGAKRDSHQEPAIAEERESVERQETQMERKRKISMEILSESGYKRPVAVVVRSVTGNEETLTNVSVQGKPDDVKEMEVDDNPQKNSCNLTDHKSGIVFRNPPSPLKVKKPKPRPEPLFIPANVNHFGFQSRLRSPRLWDGLTKQQALPPYTPPPMLSPARSGSGLFWTLHNGYCSPLPAPPVLPKYGKSKGGISWNENVQPTIEYEKEPPATDTQPHINIGSQYQPELPNFHDRRPVGGDYAGYDDHSTLVWNPITTATLREDEVMQYMDYACCAAIPGNGINKEYALHLLHICEGDMKKAGRLLLEPEPKLPRSSGLTSYKYQECVKWKKAEIELFHRAIMKVDKDFYQMSKLVSTKSVKDCVQFYYLWKKICPDESKQLKLLRRKREQLELYSRRSKDLHDQSPPSVKPCVQQNSSDKTSASSSEMKRDLNNDSTKLHYRASDSLKEEKLEDGEKRWCSICKRSFTSARNFSVHMKKHKQSTSRTEPVEFSQAVKLPYPTLNSVF